MSALSEAPARKRARRRERPVTIAPNRTALTALRSALDADGNAPLTLSDEELIAVLSSDDFDTALRCAWLERIYGDDAAHVPLHDADALGLVRIPPLSHVTEAAQRDAAVAEDMRTLFTSRRRNASDGSTYAALAAAVAPLAHLPCAVACALRTAFSAVPGDGDRSWPSATRVVRLCAFALERTP